MSEDNKTQPSHRVRFAAKRTDNYGKEQLGRPVEIGAIWPRRDPEKEGGILRLDIIPQDLGNGVLFVTETEREKERAQEGRGDAFERNEERAAERDKDQELEP